MWFACNGGSATVTTEVVDDVVATSSVDFFGSDGPGRGRNENGTAEEDGIVPTTGAGGEGSKLAEGEERGR